MNETEQLNMQYVWCCKIIKIKEDHVQLKLIMGCKETYQEIVHSGRCFFENIINKHVNVFEDEDTFIVVYDETLNKVRFELIEKSNFVEAYDVAAVTPNPNKLVIMQTGEHFCGITQLDLSLLFDTRVDSDFLASTGNNFVAYVFNKYVVYIEPKRSKAAEFNRSRYSIIGKIEEMKIPLKPPVELVASNLTTMELLQSISGYSYDFICESGCKFIEDFSENYATVNYLQTDYAIERLFRRDSPSGATSYAEALLYCEQTDKYWKINIHLENNYQYNVSIKIDTDVKSSSDVVKLGAF